MFNTLGGRSLLVGRGYGTGAGVGQGTAPMPAGYYRPGSEYNWYSYSQSDPINGFDVTGYLTFPIPNWVIGAAGMALGAVMMFAGGVVMVEAFLNFGVAGIPVAYYGGIPFILTGYKTLVAGYNLISDERKMKTVPYFPFR